MANFLSFFAPQKKLLQQQQELKALKKELETLKQQNESMRQGMRRCVTCDYRVDFKQQQDEKKPG